MADSWEGEEKFLGEALEFLHTYPTLRPSWRIFFVHSLLFRKFLLLVVERNDYLLTPDHKFRRFVSPSFGCLSLGYTSESSTFIISKCRNLYFRFFCLGLELGDVGLTGSQFPSFGSMKELRNSGGSYFWGYFFHFCFITFNVILFK